MKSLIGREKSIPSSVIKNVNTFPAIKPTIRTISTVCSVTVRCMRWGMPVAVITNCLLPHVRKNYGYVTGKYSEIMEVAGKNRKENRELIQETAEELKTLTEESLTEESAESRKACLEKIRELAERLVAASGADACGK